MKVSVVVPARNERERIGQLLESLSRQTKPPFEVIVVDNGSTDGTAEVVQGYAGVKLVNEPVVGVARARNTGVKVSKGEIIASTDADCVVAEDWIEKIEEYFRRNPEMIAVVGRVDFDDAPGLIKLLRAVIYEIWFFKCLRWFFGFQPLYGANSTWRKAVFDQVGGFDETIISPNGLEDAELGSRLSRRGDIGYDMGMRVSASFRRYDGWGKSIRVNLIRMKRMLEIAYAYRS